MGILDEDFTPDDPFKPVKTDEGFRMDFSLDNYAKKLTGSLGATGGGDGGGLPADLYQAPKIEPIVVPDSTVKAVKVEPIKPLVQPTVTAVKAEPVKPYAKLNAESPSGIDRGIAALNRIVRPALQDSESTATLGLRIQDEVRVNPADAANQINKLSRSESASSEDVGNLGIRIQREVKVDPEEVARQLNQLSQGDRQGSAQTGTLGLRAWQEGNFNLEALADNINQIAQADRTESENTATPGTDPRLFLAKMKSAKWRQETSMTLAKLMNNYSDAPYRATADNAQAMQGITGARFHPEAINQYGNYERQYARAQVENTLKMGENIKWDPELARQQVYPILDRYNTSHGYDTMGNSSFAGANFSPEILAEQIGDHMLKGTELNYSHVEQTAHAMKSLEKTGYGRTVTDIMASVYTGSLNIGQEAANTLMIMMQGYPPPEVMAFGYQMSWLTHGNDTAAWAKEIEDNREYANYAKREVYSFFDDGKNMLKDLRSDSYNDLQYFTSDPSRSAFLRPDKMTGDFFEKFVPTMVSLALPNKLAAVGNLSKGATLFTEFTYIGTRAFNLGAAERVNTLIKTPEMVDNNPKFHEYLKNTSQPYDVARNDFIQAEGRRAGVQAGILSLVTAGISMLFLRGATTGEEGPALQMIHQFIMHEVVGETSSEVLSTVNADEIKQVIERGDIER